MRCCIDVCPHALGEQLVFERLDLGVERLDRVEVAVDDEVEQAVHEERDAGCVAIASSPSHRATTASMSKSGLLRTVTSAFRVMNAETSAVVSTPVSVSSRTEYAVRNRWLA